MTSSLGRWTADPRPGFTLLEVVIALVVLEIAVLGSVGTIALASSTLARAERLERAVALAEGVLDSLAAAPDPIAGTALYGAGEVRWTLDAAGGIAVRALGATGDTLFTVGSVLAPASRP